MNSLRWALLLLAITSAASAQSNNEPSPPDSAKLVPIKTVKAIYPLSALANRSQGQVLVKLHINEAGDVESAEVVRRAKRVRAVGSLRREEMEVPTFHSWGQAGEGEYDHSVRLRRQCP
jgi:hypothetical protein